MEYTLTEVEPGTNRLLLHGRLDAASVDAHEPQLLAALSDAPRNTLVDLSGVSFVGSRGIRLLIVIARRLHQKGLVLILVAPQPMVLEVFEIAMLGDLIPIAATEAEALLLVPR
jgi:anti-sigma B factor antagonist